MKLKPEHEELLVSKLPEIQKQFNKILADHGLGNLSVQSVNFTYPPCINGTCPYGGTPTPFKDPTTGQYTLCLCV